MNNSKPGKPSTPPKESSIWSFLKDNFISLGTMLVGFAVVLLSGLNIIPDSAILPTILALVSLLATSELVEGRHKLSRMEENLETANKRVEQLEGQIKEHLQGLESRSTQAAGVLKTGLEEDLHNLGRQAQLADEKLLHSLADLRQELLRSGTMIEVKYFDDHDEALKYQGRRLREARKSIEHAAMDRRRARSKMDGYNELDAARIEAALSGRAVYRYVAVAYTRRRVNMAREIILDKQATHYFAGLYPCSEQDIPQITFTIFDGEEVFGRAPYITGQTPGFISIKSQAVVKLFHDYFESLWQHSHRLANMKDYEEMLCWPFNEQEVEENRGDRRPSLP